MAESEKIYTPGELLYKLNDAVWTKGDKGIVTIKGVYSKQDFEISDSRYIDKIVDEVNDTRVNIIVNESIRKAVSDGNVVVTKGYLGRYLDEKDGSIRLQLRVVGMDVLEQSSRLTAKEIERSSIRHRKMTGGYKPIDSILADKLEKDRPKIVLVYPNTSIVHQDFQREIGSMAEKYFLDEVRIPFTIASRLTDEIERLDTQSYDAICLVRGGGADFGALESAELLEAVASLKTPVIAAVGHENDKLFINEVVDKFFITPTSLGGYLRRLAEECERKKQLVDSLQTSNRKLKRALIVFIICALVLIAAVIWMLVGKKPIVPEEAVSLASISSLIS